MMLYVIIILIINCLGCRSYRVVEPLSKPILLPQPSTNLDYNNLYRAVTLSPLQYVTRIPQPIPHQHNHAVESNHISLYNANEDNVVELNDGNITSSVYNSPYLWIVQFYAHWCGHCQRFVPIWKESANTFRKWNKWVKFGVINCAQATTCNQFNVQGTPTIRILYPRTPENIGNYGLDIKSVTTVEYWKNIVLNHIELCQAKGILPTQELPNLITMSRDEMYNLAMNNINGINSNYYTSSMSRYQQPQYQINYDRLDTTKHVFILESSRGEEIGKEVILSLSDKYGNSNIRRVAWMDIRSFIEYFPGSSPTKFPAVVVFQSTGYIRLPWRVWRYYPTIYSYGNVVIPNNEDRIIQQIDAFLAGVLNVTPIMVPQNVGENATNSQTTPSMLEILTRPSSTPPAPPTSLDVMMSDERDTVSTTMMSLMEPCDKWECNNGGHCIENAGLSPHYAECECTDDFEGEHCEIEIESNEDTVFAIDLEKAIEYSIMTEIPSQPELNTVKLQVFYRWLEALTKYVSMRNEIWQFLSATKTWMSQNVGGLQGLRGNMLSNKLNELSIRYHPFEETSEDWKGCNGSEPHHRGYPCGLWTLFHTITVNAAKDDNMNLFNGLSSTIVDYVQNFFQCRHCAKNFQMKVRSIKQGALPEKAKDTMMWLWQIHNMANVKLAGDLTEDPEHPKILWPSDINCPECRPHPWNVMSNQRSMMVTIEGKLWNKAATANYLVNVYSNDNIIKNIPQRSIYGIQNFNIQEGPRPSNYTLRNNQRSLNISEHENILDSEVFAESQNISLPIYQDKLNRLQAIDQSRITAMREAVEEFMKVNETSNQNLLSLYSTFCAV